MTRRLMNRKSKAISYRIFCLFFHCRLQFIRRWLLRPYRILRPQGQAEAGGCPPSQCLGCSVLAVPETWNFPKICCGECFGSMRLDGGRQALLNRFVVPLQGLGRCFWFGSPLVCQVLILIRFQQNIAKRGCLRRRVVSRH